MKLFATSEILTKKALKGNHKIRKQGTGNRKQGTGGRGEETGNRNCPLPARAGVELLPVTESHRRRPVGYPHTNTPG